VPIEVDSGVQRSVLGFTKIDRSMKAPLIQLQIIDISG